MLLEMLNSTSVQMVVVGLVAGILFQWMFQQRRYKLPPGPFAWPFIGNLHLLKADVMHKQLLEWTKDYGPVITVYFGRQPAVVLNNIETALEVLVKKSTDYAHRPSSVSADALIEGGKSIVFGQFDATWKMQRMVAGQALRNYMKGPELERRIHNAFNLVAQRMKTETGPFNPQLHVALIVFHVLYAVCFGESCDLDDKFSNWTTSLQKPLLLANFLKIIFHTCIKYGQQNDIKHSYKTPTKWSDLCRQKLIITKDHSRKNIQDFTDNLLLAKLEEEEAEPGSELLTDVHLRQTLFDIFFAGLDTSRFTLQFAVLYMAVYPDIQKKVQDEIDRVVVINEKKVSGVKEALSYLLAFVEVCLQEECLPNFFNGNGWILYMFLHYGCEIGDHKVNMLHDKSYMAIYQALLSFYDMKGDLSELDLPTVAMEYVEKFRQYVNPYSPRLDKAITR